MLKLKAAFLLGLLISLPWTLRQIWLFTKPGLHVKERKYVSRIVASALFLFPLGAAFAWFTVPYALAFLETFAFAGLSAQLEVGKYLNMVLTMMIAMGTVFELPLVVLFLVKLGIITTAQLRKYRRQSIVVIFLVSAFFTPPDVFTMGIMALPLILLYEISLIVSDILVPREKQTTHFDEKFSWDDEVKEEEES
jgi:sec-independent protein translocase protein TatC